MQLPPVFLLILLGLTTSSSVLAAQPPNEEASHLRRRRLNPCLKKPKPSYCKDKDEEIDIVDKPAIGNNEIEVNGDLQSGVPVKNTKYGGAVTKSLSKSDDSDGGDSVDLDNYDPYKGYGKYPGRVPGTRPHNVQPYKLGRRPSLKYGDPVYTDNEPDDYGKYPGRVPATRPHNVQPYKLGRRPSLKYGDPVYIDNEPDDQKQNNKHFRTRPRAGAAGGVQAVPQYIRVNPRLAKMNNGYDARDENDKGNALQKAYERAKRQQRLKKRLDDEREFNKQLEKDEQRLYEREDTGDHAIKIRQDQRRRFKKKKAEIKQKYKDNAKELKQINTDLDDKTKILSKDQRKKLSKRKKKLEQENNKDLQKAYKNVLDDLDYNTDELDNLFNYKNTYGRAAIKARKEKNLNDAVDSLIIGIREFAADKEKTKKLLQTGGVRGEIDEALNKQLAKVQKKLQQKQEQKLKQQQQKQNQQQQNQQQNPKQTSTSNAGEWGAEQMKLMGVGGGDDQQQNGDSQDVSVKVNKQNKIEGDSTDNNDNSVSGSIDDNAAPAAPAEQQYVDTENAEGSGNGMSENDSIQKALAVSGSNDGDGDAGQTTGVQQNDIMLVDAQDSMDNVLNSMLDNEDNAFNDFQVDIQDNTP